MVTVGGVELRAVSVAGLETCIEVPSWKLCFDIGRCPPTAPRLPRVLFSHAHCDHMGGVIHHCATRDLQGMSPPEYWVPAPNHGDFLELLEVWRRLDGSALPCSVRPVRGGDRIELGPRRLVSVFDVDHRVPGVGYALVERRRRLRPEHVGASSEQLRALRERGVVLDQVEEVVELAFCGDTTIEVVEREEQVRRARVLLLEVSFLDGRVSPEAAHRQGHVHLDDLVARADLFDNQVIVVTHISARYRPDEVPRLLQRALPPGLAERVVPLIPR